MRGRGPIQSLAASPTMVGAVTTLIVIVAVFLAYNANNGLPFVPVYRVSVEAPTAARLGPNNEIRIGGHRVGVVESIEPIVNENETRTASSDASAAGSKDVTPVAARLNLKLDKSAGPIPKDSIFRVRYRSSFGLKYLEIVRGTSKEAPEGFVFNGLDDTSDCALPTNPSTFASTIVPTAKNGCFQKQTEFDAISDTFDTKTREAGRQNLEGYGNALAGRGSSLNDAIQALNPLIENLGPVSKLLADPNTHLKEFFGNLGRTASIVAPVAEQQADLFTQAADTFAALSADPEALKETISEGPATLETAIDTLPRQRTFLAEFGTLVRRLQPGVRDLRFSLPSLNGALQVGTPVLARTPSLSSNLRDTLAETRKLVDQPSTKTTLQRLSTTFGQAKPLSQYVAPAQTVCNYWNYWFTYLPNALSDRDQVGYSFRQALVNAPLGAQSVGLGPLSLPAPAPTQVDIPGQVTRPVAGYSGGQANGIAGSGASTIAPPLPDGGTPGKFYPHQLPIVHANPYAPSGQDGSDCQPGQTGYVLGDLRVPGQPKSNPSVAVSDIPGSRGPTTLYWKANGTRESRDTRIASHQPSGKIVNP